MDAKQIDRLLREIEWEAARDGPPEGFPALPPVPMARYTDAAFFELEREFLWRRTWLLAAHEDELAGTGRFRVWDRAGRRLILVRGPDDVIRAFYDTCRHRGASVVPEPTGHTRRFVCRFHAWSYDLEGRLVSVPDEGDFVDLDKGCLGLRPARCERFGRFVFVNHDDDAPPLLDTLGVVPAELGQFGPEALRLVDRHTVDVACNWKLAADAFIEVYHLRVLHPATIHSLLDAKRTAIGLLPGGHSRMVTGLRPDKVGQGFAPEAPPLPGLTRLPTVANLSYFLFPNVLVPTDLRGFPILQFWPTGPRTTRIEVAWVAGDWGTGEVPEHWRNAVAAFDYVLREDLGNLTAMQESVEAGGSSSAILNYQERRIYHLHEQVDRVIGRDRIPAAMRVEPTLARFVEQP